VSAPGGLPPLLDGRAADSHAPGKLVRVKGLMKAHEHNGKLATILAKQPPEQSRVCIAMKDGKELSVKQENVEAVCLTCLTAGVFAVCGKCKTAAFCSPACQASKWRQHMNECGEGRLARADCQEKLKPSETVFFLSRCDGAGAFMLAALHRDSRTGGTVFAQLVMGIKRGIRDAIYCETPWKLSPLKSAAAFKAHLEHLFSFGSSKDRGGSADGTNRELYRRICSALAAALARSAEAETIQLDHRALHANEDIPKALDVFRRRGSAGSSEAAGDDALLADPLLGSREAAQLKTLLSSESPLLTGYQCGVRVVQLLQEKNRRYLDWIGVIYNMLHCRGEYAYCYSFVDDARMGRWPASWLPKGTSDAQKVEAALLGMHQDPGYSVSVVRVAPMMRHMSLWHSLGGEVNLSVLTLLAAEDAEACWYNSAIAVGLMVSAEPERFQCHVEFSFSHLRDRLHHDFLSQWCVLSATSCEELQDLADTMRKEQREKKRQLQGLEQDSGRKITLGSGFSEFSDAEMEDLKSGLTGMGFEMDHAAQAQSNQTANIGENIQLNLVVAADMQDLCDEWGISGVGKLHLFFTHVNNRRRRAEKSATTLNIASTLRSALPLWVSALRTSDSPEEARDALEAQTRLKPPPAGLRRQLSDVYLWGLGLKGSGAGEEIEGEASAMERNRGMALLYEAADVEEDCEAMGALADHHLVVLAREFNPQRRSEIFLGNAHLPPLTQAVKESENFQTCIRYLGRAAAKGYLSPMLWHIGCQTFADPTALHGIEGGAEITAALAQQANLWVTNVRANVLARGDSVRMIAAEEGLRGADRLRLLGNDLFKKKMYKASRTEYSKALDVVERMLEQREGAGDLEQISREIRVKCLANRAECNLKLENFPGALTDVLTAREVEWQGIPPELADKLCSREERARNGLKTLKKATASLASRDSKAAASSSSRARGRVGSGGNPRLADPPAPPMRTADGTQTAKDQASGRGLDPGAAKGCAKKEHSAFVSGTQARSAEGGEQDMLGRSGTGAEEHNWRQEEEEVDVCCVCLEESSARKPCAKMSCCAYLIHAECMEEWQEQCEAKRFPASCPACQQPCQQDVGMDLFMSKFGPLV
jgi:hypothetical protein